MPKPTKPTNRRPPPPNTPARCANRRDRVDDADGELTPLQWKFINAYVGEACGNAIDAARHAGMGSTYKEWSNRSSYALSLPRVQRAITKLLSDHALSAGMTLARLSDFTRASMADFLAIDDDGKVKLDEDGRPYVDLQRAKDSGKLHLIEEITVESDGRVRIKLPNRLEAAKILAKYHGLMVERVEVGVTGADDAAIRQGILDKLTAAAKQMSESDRAILAGVIAPDCRDVPAE